LLGLFARCQPSRPTIHAGQGRIGADGMVAIKGGSFRMGDPFGESGGDEYPHIVTLSGFYLASHEITVRQFADFVEATGYRTTAEEQDSSWIFDPLAGRWAAKRGLSWRDDATGRPRPLTEYDHPVVHVSWFDAAFYCNWRSIREGLPPCYVFEEETFRCNFRAKGYRLPSEAEWEFAARSRGKTYRYAWGNGFPKGANLLDETAAERFQIPLSTDSVWLGYADGYPTTAPVGALGHPNELGLYDMTGNVWEWCWDLYGEYPTGDVQINPYGPGRGGSVVFRGGSWDASPHLCRNTGRGGNRPGFRDSGIGFRVARSR
jgi:formylglycine-generating enzyme required for sulfatase activity